MRVNLPSNSLLYNRRNFTFSQNPVNEEENKAQAATANNIKTKAQDGAHAGKQAVRKAFSTAATIPSAVTSTLWLNKYRGLFTPEAEAVYEKAAKIARKYKSPTIELKHFWLASLMQVYSFLKEIDEGKTEFYIEDGVPNQLTLYTVTQIISEQFPPDVNKDEIRKKVEDVLKTYIQKAKDDFEQEAETRPSFSSIPVPSKNTKKAIEQGHKTVSNHNGVNTFFDDIFFTIVANTNEKQAEAYYRSFVYDLQKALMIDEPEEENKFHLGFYDEKADSLWKTVDMGKDVVVLRDYQNNKSASSYLINSFENLIKKPGNSYRNLNKDNTEIITLNKYANLEFVSKLIKEKAKANEKTGVTTIITGDFDELGIASAKASFGGNQYALDIKEGIALANIGSDDKKNTKVRLVLAMDSSAYLANASGYSPMAKIFKDFAPLSLPEITSNNAKQYLTDEKGLEFIENKIGKPVDKKAIEKAIELTKDDEGNYPDKALNLLNKTSNCFAGSDSVSEAQVIEYSKQIQELTETTDTEEEGTIIYDTHKTLDDIVGSQMTKDAAQSVVDEIKYGVKTKGYLIYQSDYTSDGGGRRHTAEAIAGEAQIPMIVINAKEFLQKDYISLSHDPNFAESKIQKLITKVKTQAKATPNNTAMVFIENFDDFAADPYKGYVDPYAQKAFSQLLTEMKKAQREKDVNLIVMGSVNHPQVIDNNIKKPGRFMDEIVIYPPQDKHEREDLIRHYIKNLNLNIGGNENEQDEIIKHAALTTYGFKVADINYMLETAQSVSRERGKTAIDKADMTEAFMRVLYGRVNKSPAKKHSKKIVTSHEAGHALTLQIMYNIAQKQKDTPWKLPNEVNFITLDPRGYYGGAMYHTIGDREDCFETIMADIVCDYGGHASEKALYDYTGSLGISTDMEYARYRAESAVVDMGMGRQTGVRHIGRDYLNRLNVSERQKQAIEDDEELILSTAEEIADDIVSEYKKFIKKFTENHWRKVGTGECIITAEEFNAELNDWIARQDKDKKESLEKLEKKIVKKMERAKYGKKAKKK